jgi:hypothetical protein
MYMAPADPATRGLGQAPYYNGDDYENQHSEMLDPIFSWCNPCHVTILFCTILSDMTGALPKQHGIFPTMTGMSLGQELRDRHPPCS